MTIPVSEVPRGNGGTSPSREEVLDHIAALLQDPTEKSPSVTFCQQLDNVIADNTARGLRLCALKERILRTPDGTTLANDVALIVLGR